MVMTLACGCQGAKGVGVKIEEERVGCIVVDLKRGLGLPYGCDRATQLAMSKIGLG